VDLLETKGAACLFKNIMKTTEVKNQRMLCESCSRFSERCGGWKQLDHFLKGVLSRGCWEPEGCLPVEDESSAQKESYK
jgi:hypothetical protein